jgi:hypothetical protein
LAVLAGVFVYLQFGEHHPLPSGKVEAMEMLRELPEYGTVPTEGKGKATRVYFSTADGSRIGVDFSANVVVVLSPGPKGPGDWHCSGSPIVALPKSCSPLQK